MPLICCVYPTGFPAVRLNNTRFLSRLELHIEGGESSSRVMLYQPDPVQFRVHDVRQSCEGAGSGYAFGIKHATDGPGPAVVVGVTAAAK